MAVLVAGCASIVSGTRQNISFASTPSGAQVMVDNQAMGVTPVAIKLARKSEHTVRITLDRYAPHEIKLTRGFNAWYLGNLVFGGVIGLVVDAVNGAMYKLSPEQVSAALAAAGTQIEDRDGTLFIAVVMRADPTWQRIGALTPLQ
jgi:hypothetical protein